MAEILYKYCYDENDELICIDDINKENRHDHKYKCLCCGRDMIAKLSGGGIRSKRSHFAHEANVSCNSETYLHKLAKIRIREKFYAESELVVHLHDVSKCCENDRCKMFNEHLCYKEVNETYNLCDYYDTCEEERGIDGVVADLLLTKSDKPNRDPVLIEVYVKHRCSEEKVSKGLKIFETKQIKSEHDIDDIINNGIITSSPSLSQIFDCGIGYNIKPSKRYDTDVSRFILFPTWGSKIVPISCNKRGEVSDNTSLVELNINNQRLLKKGFDSWVIPSPKMIGLLYVAHRASQYKNCLLCKYLTSDSNYQWFCPLSKKYGTPQSPRESYGMRCKYFQICALYRDISLEDLYECIELVKEEGKEKI